MSQKKHKTSTAPLKYSVIIPMKDEEQNVAALIDELETVMDSLKQRWELICIDDGSTDGTRSILRDLLTTKPFLRILAFAGNYGQSSAFDAGFRTARGEIIITMDGDRQNDPRDIPNLLQKIDKYDLVCGRRAKRQDSWLKKIISRVANSVRSWLCDDETHDTGCSLKVYKSHCLHNIKMFHGMHRFLPALFRIEGFRTTEVNVNHRERTGGKSKYNLFNRGFSTISDLLAVVWMRRRRLHYTIEQELSASPER